MQDGLCPTCGRVGRWTFRRVLISYPPTGGDADWVETDGVADCPYCDTSIAVRVRVDLTDRSVSKIVHSPLPIASDFRCFVVAEVRFWAEDDVQVKVSKFAETLNEAQEALTASGGGFDVGYLRKGVFVLSTAGYADLDGSPLPDSSKDRIRYA